MKYRYQVSKKDCRASVKNETNEHYNIMRKLDSGLQTSHLHPMQAAHFLEKVLAPCGCPLKRMWD
jgi:hypothetical protein